MGSAKDRVLAIDYFRGVAMLSILLVHASIFTNPFDVLVGAGRLWTGAAEAFFLLSGLTFGIVRGHRLKKEFGWVVKKTYRRALALYIFYILSVIVSLALLIFFKHTHHPAHLPGALPVHYSAGFFADLLLLRYSIGWADFLMYYSIYLLLAPFAYKVLQSRVWPAVPLIAVALYTVGTYNLLPTGGYRSFLTWQLYFALGLCMARVRPALLSWFYNLPKKTERMMATAIIIPALAVLFLSGLVEFNFRPLATRFHLASAYQRLLDSRPQLDKLLVYGRMGILRPLVALLVMAAVYLIYQKLKEPLLNKTGRFVIGIGQDTLIIFLAQAFVIPLMAAPSISRGPVNDFFMTVALFAIIWLVHKRTRLWLMAKGSLGREIETETT